MKCHPRLKRESRLKQRTLITKCPCFWGQLRKLLRNLPKCSQWVFRPNQRNQTKWGASKKKDSPLKRKDWKSKTIWWSWNLNWLIDRSSRFNRDLISPLKNLSNQFMLTNFLNPQIKLKSHLLLQDMLQTLQNSRHTGLQFSRNQVLRFNINQLLGSTTDHLKKFNIRGLR